MEHLKAAAGGGLRKGIRRLLAAACLAALASSLAWGTTFNESTVGDFSNTFAGANLMPAGTTQVIGTLSVGDVDYFKFAGLEPGSTYLFTEGYVGVALYGVVNSSNVLLNALSAYSDPMSGTVPVDGILVVVGIATTNSAEYTINLFATEASGTAPEPATLAVTGLALVVLAGLRRRKK